MIGQELKIIFKKDKAYLTTDKSLSFEQLRLPEVAKSFKSTSYWTINVVNYIENEGTMSCKIISYNVGETEFGYNQKILFDKLNKIKIVKFLSIDTIGLIKTLEANKPLTYHSPKNFTANGIRDYYSPGYIIEEPIREVIKKNITETFFIPFKKVHFKHGSISFDKKFKEFNKSIKLTISNDEIREEFDSVKNYFSNVLKTKKIQVTAKIEIIDDEISQIDVKSLEIDKIDKQLIDNVRFDVVRSTIKKKITTELDNGMYTMDEYFEVFAEEKFKLNIFYKNDKEFFEDLLKISNSKHYKHLRFLSSKHFHDMKLMFLHKPFSFIFIIEGDKNYHIIWETLDTKEATYVWHTVKDKDLLKVTLQKIEDIIKIIKANGKTSYLNSNEDSFTRIYHVYTEIIEDGFIKWKNELESILI